MEAKCRQKNAVPSQHLHILNCFLIFGKGLFYMKGNVLEELMQRKIFRVLIDTLVSNRKG